MLVGLCQLLMFIGGCAVVATLVAAVTLVFGSGTFLGPVVAAGTALAAWLLWHLPFAGVVRWGAFDDVRRAQGRR
jgi:hypothetical protein